MCTKMLVMWLLVNQNIFCKFIWLKLKALKMLIAANRARKAKEQYTISLTPGARREKGEGLR